MQTKEKSRRRVRILAVIPNKSGRLLLTVIEVGGGGGALASINFRNDNEKIEETSK